MQEDCKGFVTFIDILGIKAAMEEKTCEEMAEMYRIVQRCLDPLIGVDPDNRKLYGISDSIFYVERALDESDDAWLEQLRVLLMSLSRAMIRLLNWGITIRGGITYGTVHIPESPRGFLFGPALVDIVDIERVLGVPSLGIERELWEKLQQLDSAGLPQFICPCETGSLLSSNCLRPFCAVESGDYEALDRALSKNEGREDAVGEKYRWLRAQLAQQQ